MKTLSILLATGMLMLTLSSACQQEGNANTSNNNTSNNSATTSNNNPDKGGIQMGKIKVIEKNQPASITMNYIVELEGKRYKVYFNEAKKRVHFAIYDEPTNKQQLNGYYDVSEMLELTATVVNDVPMELFQFCIAHVKYNFNAGSTSLRSPSLMEAADKCSCEQKMMERWELCRAEVDKDAGTPQEDGHNHDHDHDHAHDHEHGNDNKLDPAVYGNSMYWDCFHESTLLWARCMNRCQ